ncbi:MAG TPA: response regulator [Pyrinomonadaceae bacterium]|nr:response regulator [Pyrinomonadaceae bacterium]
MSDISATGGEPLGANPFVMSTAPNIQRVLCVEDSLDTCKLIAKILTGYEIISATTIDEAWRLYNAQSFSLIVLDYRLTDGDGLDFCERVRSMDFMTPIIFITGDPDLTDADVRMAGGQRLIRKGSPTFVDDLFANAHTLAVTNS